MKKIALMLLTVVLVAVLLGIAPQSALADEPPPPKGPNCYIGLEGFTFTPDDECVNYYLGMAGWGATTRGLVVSFLTAEQNTLSVSGPGYNLAYTPEQAALYWTPPAPYGADENCPQQAIWASWWLVPLGTNLAPGEYTIQFTWDLSHPITDGYQACIGYPNGRNIYNGYLWDDAATFTIVD